MFKAELKNRLRVENLNNTQLCFLCQSYEEVFEEGGRLKQLFIAEIEGYGK